LAKKKKSEQSKAYDRDTANRLIGLDRAIRKPAPKPQDPKKGN
jgi:hypothetical protein